MEKSEIIKKLFPKPLPLPGEIENKYPDRKLKEGAMVTRIAPSPTGFMHIGGLYAALISERLAHQTGGKFYLRIEDTDKKREVEGAIKIIVDSLEHYGIRTDEGETSAGIEIGEYGPYKQSERAKIYQSYVKYLIDKNMAYPCFSTSEELDDMRNMQEVQGVRSGYYKQWAKWRDKSDQEVLSALSEGKKFVIRFKSCGDIDKKILIEDAILGKREISENDQDIIIMKSDGLPTYHMAHVVDDHLMRTTHVIRGNEWFASLSLHLQLFKALEWKAPIYGHIFPIQKMEGNSKRKLSKRKDPEANVEYYDKQGYSVGAVIEYLLNLANSNFEDWKKANPDKNNHDFTLTLKKLSSSSGPLFDFNKLNDISKEIIAKYSAEEVYRESLIWAKRYDLELASMMENNSAYTTKILDIERSGQIKIRKDIGKWSDVKREIEYFFDENFKITKDEVMNILSDTNIDTAKNIVSAFIESYDEKDSREEWFEKVKKISRDNNYAENAKEFKNNPEKYKGNVADVAKIFRVMLTGKVQTPDLHSIMQVMGRERVFSRLSLVLS